MRCHNCRSEMHQTDRLVEGRALQTWYRCPLCAASQTVSEPCEAGVRRVGNAHRSSGGWALGLHGDLGALLHRA